MKLSFTSLTMSSFLKEKINKKMDINIQKTISITYVFNILGFSALLKDDL